MFLWHNDNGDVQHAIKETLKKINIKKNINFMKKLS